MRTFPFAVLAVLIGCGPGDCPEGQGRASDGACYPLAVADDTGDTGTGDTDTDTDTGADTGDTDTGTDTGDTDTGADTGDSGQDTGQDTGTDTGQDTGQDTGDTGDTGADTGVDTADTGADTADTAIARTTFEGTFEASSTPSAAAVCHVTAWDGPSPATSTNLGGYSIACPSAGGVPTAFTAEFDVGGATAIYLMGAVDESGTIYEADAAGNPYSASSGGTVTGVVISVDNTP